MTGALATMADPAPGAPDIPDMLRAARRDWPGCDSLIFGDLGSATVLCAEARADAARQERHDALLLEARALLVGLAPAPSEGACALVLVPGETRMALVLPQGETLALRTDAGDPAAALARLHALGDRLRDDG